VARRTPASQPGRAAQSQAAEPVAAEAEVARAGQAASRGETAAARTTAGQRPRRAAASTPGRMRAAADAGSGADSESGTIALSDSGATNDGGPTPLVFHTIRLLCRTSSSIHRTTPCIGRFSTTPIRRADRVHPRSQHHEVHGRQVLRDVHECPRGASRQIKLASSPDSAAGCEERSLAPETGRKQMPEAAAASDVNIASGGRSYKGLVSS
jgi:hypothetical protein